MPLSKVEESENKPQDRDGAGSAACHESRLTQKKVTRAEKEKHILVSVASVQVLRNSRFADRAE